MIQGDKRGRDKSEIRCKKEEIPKKELLDEQSNHLNM